MKKLQFCLVSISLLLLALGAVAQVQNGQFTGTVTDPSGAAIPNAKVTVTNQGTGLSVATTTNQTGLYTARELPVGTYKIEVDAPGFRTVTNTGLVLNAGTIQHVDMKMQMGQAKEVVEVTGAAAAVNTEDAKLSSTVGSTQINNLPVNGRNVFDLMQLSAGAVNVSGTDFENGHMTVVNGVREDFNGFLVNGVSNKGLSGGVVNTPIQDTVEEFQQLGLNMSAQYGNSAGSTVNLVTKSGTNAFHGSAWEYNRNNTISANDYFFDQNNANLAASGQPRLSPPPLHWNQFGATLGGPIVKDKLFFFAAYQGSRFTYSNVNTLAFESPQWRNAVASADAATGVNSVAGLLYKNFQPTVGGSTLFTLDQYIGNVTSGDTGLGCAAVGANGLCTTPNYADYLCPDTYSSSSGFGLPAAQASIMAARFQSILGVVPAVDNAMPLTYTGAPCSTPLTAQAGFVGRNAAGLSSMPFQLSGISLVKAQTGAFGNVVNLFNGNEWSGRFDFIPSGSNRFSIAFDYARNTDKYGPCGNPACARGFFNPEIVRTPNGQFSFIHTFSPTILNEFRAGYSQNASPLLNVAQGGVPSAAFDDGSSGFGSYSGYPQFFKENVYTYSDMVSVTHGNHNMKIGGDVRRNIENSQFNVARPSYYFTDPLFFAADAPYGMTAGVNPGICNPPCSQASIQSLISSNTIPNSSLSSNFRHWRNIEFGAYFQDDWKATKRLTLQLGLRYDLYKRHTEENNLATTFKLGPGGNTSPIYGVENANIPAGNPGCDTNLAQESLAQLAGVCGPGGFAPSSTLGAGRHHDFGPRLGFAYDVFGNGKTALRGGFGISYEGTLYNPLSNSRWNLPYYSFNQMFNAIGGGGDIVVYGPTACTASSGGVPGTCVPTGGAQFGPGGIAPTFTGPPTNPNQGPPSQAQAQGNIDGWYGNNPNTATLTGIIFPQGIDDPYVYNYYFGIQHEIFAKNVIEVNYVGTTGHKLFRAEDVNRLPGALLPAGSSIVNNIGETLIGLGGRPNPNYGRLRVWENVVNSNYNSLQASFRRQVGRLQLNANYTFSHSIDNGSTWHSGATTANGAAGGEGFTTDPTRPQLDRGNSIFDIRHRLVINHVFQLPGQHLTGVLGEVAGGWSLSGIWSFQTGPHWQAFRGGTPHLKTISSGGVDSCTAADVNSGNCENLGGDYLLTHGRNERPNSSLPTFVPTRAEWANGWNGDPASATGAYPGIPTFSAPCLGCVGNLGRNNFVGPGLWETDLTLAKTFRITERVGLKLEGSAFNVFNRPNFVLATAGGLGHNDIRSTIFGKAAGTQGARSMQIGAKISF